MLPFHWLQNSKLMFGSNSWKGTLECILPVDHCRQTPNLQSAAALQDCADISTLPHTCRAGNNISKACFCSTRHLQLHDPWSSARLLV